MTTNRKRIYNKLVEKGLTINFKDFGPFAYWHPAGDGNRLRLEGLKLFKKYQFPYYTVEVLDGLDKKELPSKHYIFLARYCKNPYYIGTDKIIFLDEEEAFVFKMCDGNIDNVKDISPGPTN